jgi:hypothetical protein
MPNARAKLIMSSMPSVRRRLSWMIRVWLICQIAGFAAAPTALGCGGANAVDVDETPACCRGLGPGETCPMHHSHDGSDTTCKMRSVCGRSDAALLTLAGGLGVLPSATISVTAFDPGAILGPIRVSTVLRPQPPEPPPPRA